MFIKLGLRNHLITYIFLYVFYKLVLDIIYVNWVYPYYGYSGYSLVIDYNNLLVSYIMLILLTISVPKGDSKLSFMILQIHLIIIYIPMLTLYGVGGADFEFIVLSSICFFIQSYAMRLIPSIKIIRIKYDMYSRKVVFIILTLLTTFTYVYLLKSQNINWSAINLENIYNIRANLSVGGGLFAYLVTWQYRIVNPFIIVNSFVRDRKILCFFSVLLQVITYFILPLKEILLSLGLILIVLFFNKLKVQFSKNFVSLISMICVSSILIFTKLKTIIPFALVTRLLFEPAKIKFQYFDFFTTHNKLLYSEGLIGKILGLNYPYSKPIGFIIYNYFEPIGTSNSNAGYIAYAYANSGFLGMLIMSILFIIILFVLDSLSSSQNKLYILSILIYPMILLNDGDLLTMLLTGGLFLLIILLFLQEKFYIFKKYQGRRNINVEESNT